MDTFIKINSTNYPAVIEGRITDLQWDNRESKAITLTAIYAEAAALFTNGVTWSIEEQTTIPESADAEGVVTPSYVAITDYDNSEFSVLGDIQVHTDGTCTVYMGKPTDLESAYELLYGGK
jgi:hypothetical protein